MASEVSICDAGYAARGLCITDIVGVKETDRLTD